MRETKQSILHKLNQNSTNTGLNADKLDELTADDFAQVNKDNTFAGAAVFANLTTFTNAEVVMSGLLEFIDNAAAVTGGIALNGLYTTSGTIKIVV